MVESKQNLEELQSKLLDMVAALSEYFGFDAAATHDSSGQIMFIWEFGEVQLHLMNSVDNVYKMAPADYEDGSLAKGWEKRNKKLLKGAKKIVLRYYRELTTH